jgi:hypothetical protein
MVAMKKSHIVVWFGVALAIFFFSGWLGGPLGSAVARYWYRHKQQAEIKRDGPERAHLESVLSALNDIGSLQMGTAINANDKEVGRKSLLKNLEQLEEIKRKSNLDEIKPVTDFALGRAFVYAAMMEEQANHNEQAAQDMISAQTLFQSLGWTDYTEDRLKTLARRELDHWKLPPQSMEHGK